MSKIRMLSESMIGKIAAGEVVERPVSAIKELIENSLDAGATSVTIEIREGGLEYIRVTDNGSGIDESDIRMAFERHATSKISREQDLDAIQTLTKAERSHPLRKLPLRPAPPSSFGIFSSIHPYGVIL